MQPPLAQAASHPLDPLSADEIATACAAVRRCGRAAGELQFHLVASVEPDKDQLVAPHPPERRARVTVYQPTTRATVEAVVALDPGEVVEWEPQPGMQPAILPEESIADAERLKRNPRWQAAMRKRGIEDFDAVQVDSWMAGNHGLEIDGQGRRIGRAVAFVRTTPEDNGYAHPVEGLEAVIDRDTGEVLELNDWGVVPVPHEPGDWRGVAPEHERKDLRPLEITQPNGPSFELDGHALRWQGWRMRVSLHPIDGLTLHQVSYDDQDRVRSILHRASLSEMVVPYGDPAPIHWWRSAFDAGEVGLGNQTNSLELGCDCLGEIRYLDGMRVTAGGLPQRIPNAICIHEEDAGVLWKHTDFWSGASEVRRSRRLVVSSFATVANYEYGFFWYFYLDGTIQVEVKLTGILLTKARRGDAIDPYAPSLTTALSGPAHQHVFCFRLDFDLDGRANSIYEVEPETVAPGEANPWGNAFVSKRTLLRSEQEAQRLSDPARGRSWRVVNPSVLNAVGEPIAYRLVPGPGGALLAHPSSVVARRAAFATRNLWVTRYEHSEMHAAGDYPNQHPGGDGLPRWTAADRALVDTDIVAWYTIASTHFPRPEDWPIMPVEQLGFTLRPDGFFDRNPALDLPRPDACHASGNGAAGPADPHTLEGRPR